MKAQPITRGRKLAVKRVQRVLELEAKRARNAMRRAIHDFGDPSEQAMVAAAQYAETENIRIALDRELNKHLQYLGYKTKPDAATSDMAVQPPERPVDTGMSTS